MSKQLILMAGVSCLTLLAGVAHAADPASATAPSTTSEVSEVVITADKVGLLEKRPSTTVFGLSKPLIETPRAATMISDTNIQRYGITTIDQLTTVAPGAFTASSTSMNARAVSYPLPHSIENSSPTSTVHFGELTTSGTFTLNLSAAGFSTVNWYFAVTFLPNASVVSRTAR